jgi:hexosaminidase
MKYLLLIFGLQLWGSIAAGTSGNLPGIIPRPAKMETYPGYFAWTPQTAVYASSDDFNAQFLNDFLQDMYGFRATFKKPGKPGNGVNLIYDAKFPEEHYQLEINNASVVIRGGKSGVFYGIQTLLQLITEQEGSSGLLLPLVKIADAPRFPYRGAMLDVGRFFYPVADIKRFIDLMASYKLNVFHFHLSEDSGWRLESKKYPKLTQIGAYRRGTAEARNHLADGFDRLPHGGFYSRRQIRELVQYAQARNITIVPEIDMPVHIVAALTAYPEYSCTGGPFTVVEHPWDSTGNNIEKDVLCAGNENTYRFAADILDELMELFPSKIIHIGGDECPKDRWRECPKCQAKMKAENLKDENELQSYFTKRLAAHLESKGRRLMGWEEIMHGGLAPNAMIMSWLGVEAGIEAAKLHHDVVMTPHTYYYLDYYQVKRENRALEPFNLSGFLPLKKVYDYEPVSDNVPPEDQKHILGVQGCIWCEFIHSESKFEYMTWPRLIAIAETGWSGKEKNYEDFTARLAENLLQLDAKGVNFRIPEPYGFEDAILNGNTATVTLTPPVKGAEILYTLNGDDPLPGGTRYTKPFSIDLTSGPVTLKCVVRTPRGRLSALYLTTYEYEKD